MESPLKICELVEQLTWPHRISTCLVQELVKKKLHGKKFNSNDGVKENVSGA